VPCVWSHALLRGLSQDPIGIDGHQDVFNGSHLGLDRYCMVDDDGFPDRGESLTLM
jgi:hypothetical protein